MEVWKDVVGYEGLYAVSSEGRLRSFKRNKVTGELMSLPVNSTGYIRVSLHKEGSRTNHYVHRLVAQAFIPNPNNLPHINHRDENPLNNKVSNLEWITKKDNNNYGTRTQRVVANTDYEKRNQTEGYKHRLDNVDWDSVGEKHSKAVYAIYPDTNNVELFPSVKEAAKALGATSSYVAGVARGVYSEARGVKFRFADEFHPSQRYVITPEQRTYVPANPADGSVAVVSVNAKGEYKIHNSVSECAEYLGTSTGAVSDAANGNYYSTKEHVIYKLSQFDENNYKPYDPKHKAKQNYKGVVIIFPDNTYKVFNSVNDTAKYLNLKSPSSISDALKKPTKRVRGNRAVRLSEFDTTNEEFSSLTEKED